MAGNGFSTESMDTSFNAPILAFTLDIFTVHSGNNYRVHYGVMPSGNPDLQIYVGRTKGADNKDYDQVEISYQNGTAKEVWKTLMEFHRKSENEIDMNFLNHSAMLNYTSDSSAQSVSWGDNPTLYDYPSVTSIIEYDDPAHSDVIYDSDNEPQKTMYDVIQHYLLLLAKYDQASGNNRGPQYEIIAHGHNNFDSDTSNFYLEYSSSQDIKYLYITEGILDATLASRG
jgi:hypothetical protein